MSDWYNAYGSAIQRFALARIGDAEAAEDCTSETFLRAYAHRGRFQCTGDGVRPWLFTIARNIANDYIKSAWRRREQPTEHVSDDHDPRLTPEEIAERKSTLYELARCLDQLPARQAECLRLRFFDDLSVGEVALVMGRRENAIRALQYRAIRKLTKIVARGN